MLKGLRTGHCAGSMESKGDTVQHEVGRGQGAHCKGPYMAKAQFGSKLCSGKSSQGFFKMGVML